MLKNTNIVRLTNGLQTDAIEGFKKNLSHPFFIVDELKWCSKRRAIQMTSCLCSLIFILNNHNDKGNYLTISWLLILITSSRPYMDEMTEKYLSGQVVEFVDSYLNFWRKHMNVFLFFSDISYFLLFFFPIDFSNW